MSVCLVAVRGLFVAGVMFPNCLDRKYVCFGYALYVGWNLYF